MKIVETLNSCIEFLRAVKELEHEEPSILEIAKALQWNYPKANNIAKALQELGWVTIELYQGMPRKFIVRLTEKGKCIISCIQS